MEVLEGDDDSQWCSYLKNNNRPTAAAAATTEDSSTNSATTSTVDITNSISTHDSQRSETASANGVTSSDSDPDH